MRDDVVVATYTYDQNGNRLDDGALYDRQDRLTERAATTYSYGENGDLVSKETSIPSGVETTEYDYDVLGGLRSVTLPDGHEIDYVLDPLGRRIRKDINGTPSESWLYRSATQPVLWTHDGVTDRFVYALGRHVPDYMVRGTVVYQLVTDHLGSLRLVVNASTWH